MKKTLIILILTAAILISPIMAGNRESLYQRFGPILIEAVVLVIKDEINVLRVEAGLPERTNQQLINAIEQKHDTLESYQWMQIR